MFGKARCRDHVTGMLSFFHDLPYPAGMEHWLWLAVYCGLILLASLAGGWIPILITLTHKRMELAISFVAGVMLGVGVLHMLPHAFMVRLEAQHADPAHGHLHIELHDLHDLINPLLLWMVAGFLVMFLIARFFRFHHHDAPESVHDDGRDHAHEHGHDHAAHQHHHSPAHGMSWAGAAFGLSLHSIIEGIALASSMEVARSGHGAAIAGLATFLVIFLHKPFDAMTIGTLMAIGRHSVVMRHAVNAAFSLLIPVGVLLFYMGLMGVEDRAMVAGAALAFSAGTFLCISMSDLLPELQFHQHDRVKLSAALLAGLAVAWGISALESRLHHPHEHADDPAEVRAPAADGNASATAHLYTVMLVEYPTLPAAS